MTNALQTRPLPAGQGRDGAAGEGPCREAPLTGPGCKPAAGEAWHRARGTAGA